MAGGHPVDGIMRRDMFSFFGWFPALEVENSHSARAKKTGNLLVVGFALVA